MKKVWIKVFLCLLVFACLSGCSSKKSKRPFMNIDFVGGEDGKTYKKMNGSEQYTFKVEEGSYYDVAIDITKERGTLNMTIRRDGDEGTIYTGNDLITSQFTVRADQVGSYTVLFTADNFIGDYSCNLTCSTSK